MANNDKQTASGSGESTERQISKDEDKFSQLTEMIMKSMAELNGKFTDLQGNINSMDGKFAGLKGEIKEDMKNEIVSKLDGKITNLEGNISEQVGQLHGKITDLRDNMEKLDGNIFKQVGQLKGEMIGQVTELKEVIGNIKLANEQLNEKFEKLSKDVREENGELTSNAEGTIIRKMEGKIQTEFQNLTKLVDRRIAVYLSILDNLRSRDHVHQKPKKRQRLRDLLRLEKSGTVFELELSSLNSNVELVVCETKLHELTDLVNNFDTDNAVNENNRIQSRLQHIIRRLNNITDIQVQSEKCNLLKSSKELLEILENIMNTLDRQTLQQHSILDEACLVATEPTLQPCINMSPQISRPNELNISRTLIEARTVMSTSYSHSGAINRESNNLITTNASQVPRISEISRLGNIQGGSLNFPRSSNHVTFATHSSNMNQSDSQDDHSYFNRNSLPHSHLNSYRRQNCSLPSDHLQQNSSMIHDNLNRPSSPFDEEAARCSAIVAKWNWTFDGKSGLLKFLERLEELRISRGLTRSQLFKSASELFVGSAKIWFRAIRQYVTSWEELIFELKSAFLPHDFVNDMWDEIRKRTQGAHEKVVIYITTMENLFNRLPKLPEEPSRVSIIQRNLLPYIQEAISTHLTLQPVNRVRDLIKICRTAEETRCHVERFCPPTTNYRSLLQPDLAYHSPNSYRLSSIEDDRNHLEHFSSPSMLPTVQSIEPLISSIPTTVGIAPNTPTVTNNRMPISHYILTHTTNDERPYLEIDILGRKIKALLDSGATKTVVGTSGLNLLQQLGFQMIRTSPSHCTVANNQLCRIVGQFSVPIKLVDKTKVINVLVVPDVEHTFILGVNFWVEMGIIPNLRKGCWSFDSDETQVVVNSIKSQELLTAEQQTQLNALLDKYFTVMGDKIGRTTVTEHQIIIKNDAFETLFQDIRKRLDNAFERSKKRYDLRRRPLELTVGDLVWKRNYVVSDAANQFTRKLAPKFTGPYKIVKKLSSTLSSIRVATPKLSYSDVDFCDISRMLEPLEGLFVWDSFDSLR
ncbi:hypothetical protein NQ314_017112 [Rhamnusium bicolor]|uniref:Retrotransposon gag domain-containing protein n=1 Tax=Rhamnusium bicolor TaxID=1586634 RepID=A0AAV8WU68_9CUCU|nr:hypothetical protein NQ314_017112 [Rhamnusium bicolor]